MSQAVPSHALSVEGTQENAEGTYAHVETGALQPRTIPPQEAEGTKVGIHSTMKDARMESPEAPPGQADERAMPEAAERLASQSCKPNEVVRNGIGEYVRPWTRLQKRKKLGQGQEPSAADLNAACAEVQMLSLGPSGQQWQKNDMDVGADRPASKRIKPNAKVVIDHPVEDGSPSTRLRERKKPGLDPVKSGVGLHSPGTTEARMAAPPGPSQGETASEVAVEGCAPKKGKNPNAPKSQWQLRPRSGRKVGRAEETMGATKRKSHARGVQGGKPPPMSWGAQKPLDQVWETVKHYPKQEDVAARRFLLALAGTTEPSRSLERDAMEQALLEESELTGPRSGGIAQQVTFLSKMEGLEGSVKFWVMVAIMQLTHTMTK